MICYKLNCFSYFHCYFLAFIFYVESMVLSNIYLYVDSMVHSKISFVEWVRRGLYTHTEICSLIVPGLVTSRIGFSLYANQ